nr:uncharacterized protein LOC111987544 [Quercus suber]
MEKLAFALITASRKLRHYFQAHVINVMMDHPLKKAMNKLEATGRLIQWVVELSEFDIKYQPRHSIKAQALADFIAEFTPSYDDVSKMEGNQKWIVHVDGSSTQHIGGIGVVLQSPKGDKLKHKVRLQYQATNNEVEYEAFLKGLELAKFVEAKSILVLGDSQLIIGQVNGMYEAKKERMRKYLNRPYLRFLAPDEVKYILREIHEGACGNHSGARSLVHKVVRAGYYWLNMKADAKAYVKVCDQCQRFSNVPKQPSEYLTPMTASWPFTQ